MSLVSSKVHDVFPVIPVFPAFGNNDLPGHYILPNNSDWYKTVLTYWAPLILCEKCSDPVQKPTTMEALAKTFIEGGYYSVNIAGKTIEKRMGLKALGLVRLNLIAQAPVVRKTR